MGAAAAGGGSWFSFQEEKILVLLRLHDARNVKLPSGEALCGIVAVNAEDGTRTQERDGEIVQLEAPAQFVVDARSLVTISFRAVRPGRSVHAGALLGEVRLPLEHIAEKCGGSLYHLWLPMQPDVAGVRSSPSSEVIFERFTQSVRSAARDTRLPMVCISLCRADMPGADTEFYEPAAPSEDKASNFCSLLQSHGQHARMAQSLYRQCRLKNKGHGKEDEKDLLADSLLPMRGGPPRRHRFEDTFEADLPKVVECDWEQDPEKLQEEIDLMEVEANNRINQASDAIRSLKDRLREQENENERLTFETTQFRRQATELTMENGRLAVQLEQKQQREIEQKEFAREVRVLREQKEKLLQIVADCHRAGLLPESLLPESPSSASTAEATPSVAASTTTPVVSSNGDSGESVEQEWTNMLPRASEVFGSSFIDD